MASLSERIEQAATAHPADRGREAEAPIEIPAPGWKEIAFRSWKEAAKDNVSLVAAGVAFYGFLAMVPLLGATVLTYGLVVSPDTVLHNVSSLATSLPKDVAKLISDQLLSVAKASGGKKGLGLVAAMAIALWGARNAAGSIVIALNIAYEEEEKRGYFKVTLLSLTMTAAAVLLGMAGAVASPSASRYGAGRLIRRQGAGLRLACGGRDRGGGDALSLRSVARKGEVDVDDSRIAAISDRLGAADTRFQFLCIALWQI